MEPSNDFAVRRADPPSSSRSVSAPSEVSREWRGCVDDALPDSSSFWSFVTVEARQRCVVSASATEEEREEPAAAAGATAAAAVAVVDVLVRFAGMVPNSDDGW